MKKHFTKLLLLACIAALAPFFISESKQVPSKKNDQAYAKPAAAVSGKEKTIPFHNTPVAYDKHATNKLYADIEQREYFIQADPLRGGYQSPNRKQNIRSYYTPGKWQLQNRTNTHYDWKLDITTIGVFADGAGFAMPAKKTTGKNVGNAIDFKYPLFIEQYINSVEGVRQNFIIQSAPKYTTEVAVKLAYTGMDATQQNGNEIIFTDHYNTLSYKDIKAWDAVGNNVTAYMQLNKEDHSIDLIAKTENAIFPVTIDPVIATTTKHYADAILESNIIQGSFGFTLSDAGDVNGDGFSDVIAGSEPSSGYRNIIVFHGAANGLTASQTDTIQLEDASPIISGAGDINRDGFDDVIIGMPYQNEVRIYYGSANGITGIDVDTLKGTWDVNFVGFIVAGAGDVNGDGYSDIALTERRVDGSGNTTVEAVNIYHGSASGIITTPAVSIENTQLGNAGFGSSLSGAGDINHDGYADLLVGAPGFDKDLVDEGVVFVYYGSASGIVNTVADTLESNQASAGFGTSISDAGDINNDGFGDIIIGAPGYDNGETDEGIALIYYGAASGIINTPDTLQINQGGAGFGNSVSGAGKVNGDSFTDILVGASNYNSQQGLSGGAFIFKGSASGIIANVTDTLLGAASNQGFASNVLGAGDVNGDGYADVTVDAPGYSLIEPLEGALFVYYGRQNDFGNPVDNILEGNQANASYGAGISGAGDVNGDGYSDLLVGAPLYDNGEIDEGVVFLYYGSSTGIHTTSVVMLEANQANAHFGNAVSGACDVNGDGYGDIIVGAPLYDNGQTDEGAAFLFLGSSSGLLNTPSSTLESNQANAAFGSSLSRAGDTNGDGYSDIIIGAPLYDNGQTDEGVAFVYTGSASGINAIPATILESNLASSAFGTSVSGAADVNGDGYSDVIIGAPTFTNGESNEGAAFVYHGSGSGIVTPAAIMLEANQADAGFGSSVSGAGDVNGDGFSDIIVGALNYDNGETDEGVAFVYYGSASGIATNAPAMLECNKVNAHFAQYVSAAGDMNADGYSDIVVGAPGFSNADTVGGATFVFYGGSGGINVHAVATLSINKSTAYFGSAVSAAGDVNGDGYGDLVVGATGYTNGESNEGAAFIYQGAASIADIIITDSIESTQPGDGFGNSYASAGDVNGDGYNDVIVGAPNYDNGSNNTGAAFIYHGSVNGLSHVPNATLLGSQSNAAFASVVASAGDVNGDGYSDIIVGAPGFIYGSFNEYIAVAFIYYGSATGINPVLIDTLESGDNYYDAYRSNFGATVSTVGDVNGDGYGDIIIGSPYGGGSGSGYARVYYGSASGINHLNSSPLSSDCKGLFSSSLSSAGDINGDGYGDIIVGAPVSGTCYISQPYGAIHIYYGSDTGISYLNETYITGIQDLYAYLGSTVSTAGDINGDGFSDIVATTGVSYNGQGYSNASVIYYGSSSGIHNDISNTQIIGNAAAGIGDINGDGYGDVTTGTSVYLGSPSGLISNPVLNTIGGAPAGDINGDGFSDAVRSVAGKVYIYYGNGGGKRGNIQLFNSSSTDPIQQSNIIQSNFAIGVFAKNPQGRTKGKLVWETRSEGQPFSSASPITNSTQFTAQQSAYTDLGTAGIQLTNNIDKVGFQTKVRARIKYDAATSLNGQVYSPWLYPQGLFGAMGMNSAVLPVELLDFTAIVIDNKTVKLDWQTASEKNNVLFTVERSSNAQQWQVVAKLKGAGNSSVPKSYQAFDDHPYTGISYYRLKQTDNDGKFVYSEIRKVNIAVAQVSLRIYPNPTQHTLTVEGDKNELSTIQCFNSSGQNVNGLIRISRTNDNRIVLDISKLSLGVFYIKTTTAAYKIIRQ
ncbi:MAG: FG-GAP-like repeat-containing protein [Agriterribacter sp.]